MNDYLTDIRGPQNKSGSKMTPPNCWCCNGDAEKKLDGYIMQTLVSICDQCKTDHIPGTLKSKLDATNED